MPEAMIKSIGSYIENFEGSMTPENSTFVEGIIYGLMLAQATIAGAIEHDQENDNGNTEK